MVGRIRTGVRMPAAANGAAAAAAIDSCLAPGGRFVAWQLRAQVAGHLAPPLGVPLAACRQWRNVPPMRVCRRVKAAVPDAA